MSNVENRRCRGMLDCRKPSGIDSYAARVECQMSTFLSVHNRNYYVETFPSRFFYLQPGSTELADNAKRIIFLQIFYDEWSISDGESMAAVKLLSNEEKYTAAQKNRVHFKNQAIKFSSILCFVNVDFDIIFVNRL
jgi:hypothetical protein